MNIIFGFLAGSVAVAGGSVAVAGASDVLFPPSNFVLKIMDELDDSVLAECAFEESQFTGKARVFVPHPKEPDTLVKKEITVAKTL